MTLKKRNFDALIEKKCQTARILIAEDELIMVAVYEAMLQGLGECIYAKTGMEAIEQLKKQSFDLVILDHHLPDATGLAICKSLRKNISIQHLPIIMITANEDDDFESKCWEVGCSVFVLKPFKADTLRHRILSQLKLKFAFDALDDLSTHDQLTGLLNRHYLESVVSDLRHSCEQCLCILMIDVDYFKNYNDHYGHQKGDICLKRVAEAIKSSVREPDQVSIRYGGEEFLIILPKVTAEIGTQVAKRIQSNIAQAAIEHEASQKGIVTVSIGVSAANNIKTEECWESLISQADQCLYRAKENGRNEIVCA